MTSPTGPLSVAAATEATAPETRAPRRSLRRFLKPYRSTLSLASGLTLVETLLDLARPWPLKLAVDNAIGGGPWSGRWPSWISSARRGWRRWPRWAGSPWSGSGRWSGI
jgi:hypothetical protein